MTPRNDPKALAQSRLSGVPPTAPLSGAESTPRPPHLGRAVVAALLSLVITAAAMVVVLRSPQARPSPSGGHPAQSRSSAPGHRPHVPHSDPPGRSQADSWPAGTTAWTVQVGSFKRLGDARRALAALQAHGVSGTDSGILRSDHHPGLVAGYWVVYAGVLATRDAAAASTGLAAARAAGFSDAFPRLVMPAVP